MFHTERLHLRKLTMEDAPFIFNLLNTPDWIKYIGDRRITSIDKAAEYIEKNYLPSYQDGLGNFLVEFQTDQTSIGCCGLYKRENLKYPDIGFAFLPEFYGKGYGYESAYLLLEYALKDLQLKKVLGFTVAHNEPSIKLLEKLGLKKEGTFHFEEDSEELLLFST
ncbi:MAG: RimJ/RimL family protein N-acetyltransferase [Alteromonas sp.]|nr:RimJ/RimL family protein N-acetyltransferase [Alteromonas sp.]MAY23005.1 RimJ/RimL family protein N-acetyltransferase [Flavobacteriaceae bacterium]